MSLMVSVAARLTMYGKMAFIFCGDAATARARAAEGYDSVTTALDALMLTDAYRSLVKDIRA